MGVELVSVKHSSFSSFHCQALQFTRVTKNMTKIKIYISLALMEFACLIIVQIY